MHVELSGQTLFSFIKAANAIASASDQRPILRGVLLVASDEGLEIQATDLVVSLWLQIPLSDGVTVKKTGRCVVNAQNLKGILDTLKQQDVTLKSDEKRLLVSAGKGKRRSKFQSVVEDARDFPTLKRFAPDEPYAQIIGKDLSGLISRTAFCAHGERSHYLMHGLLLRANEGTMTVVATDGRRLGVSTAPLVEKGVTASIGPTEDGVVAKCPRCESGKAPFMLQQEGVEEGVYCEDCRPADPSKAYAAEIVIPAGLASNVNRVIGDAEETVDIQWLERGVSIRGSRGEISIHALNGNYPEFERGIRKNSKVITLDRKKFIEILKQTNVFKSAATAFVDLILEDGRMIFRSLVDGAGQTEIESELEWPYEALNLVVNPDFMHDAAVAMRGDEISFEIEDYRTPTVLRERPNGGALGFHVFSVARK